MTDVRRPRPPDERVTLVRPPSDAARPDAPDDLPPDPEAAIDTQEISLAELRAAARVAGVELHEADVAPDAADAADAPAVGASEPATVVDLVGAEQHDGAGPAPFGGEPFDGAPEDPAPRPGAAAGDGVDEVVDRDEPDLDRDLDTVVEAAVGPIDPRMQERRVAVTAAQLARRRRLTLWAIAVASVVGIGWLVVQAPFLSVQHVRVDGATQQTRVAVERAAAVEDGTPVLFLDTGSVEARVEALPWVAEASVARDLPNGIVITVEERLPVAWARRPAPVGAPPGALGPAAVVDVSGRVLGDEPQPPPGLPEIVGLAAVPARGGHIATPAAAAALAALPDPLRAQTAALALRRGQAVLQLATPPGGVAPAAGEVRLGRLEQVAQKGAAALAILDQLAAGGEQVRYVDVRVPNAPATGD